MNDAVVAAFRDVVPLFINIDADPKGVCDTFEVRLRPTLVCADQNGKVVQKYEGEKQIPNLQQAVSDFGRKFFKDYEWAESLAQAKETAKTEKKYVALYFADDTDASKQFVKGFKESSVKSIVSKYVFVKVAFKKDSEEAKRYSVSKAVSLAILHPDKDEVVDRLEGKKTLKDLKSFLEKNVRKPD